MPTYEYECRSCKHTFEAFQSIKDEPIKKCPKCGKSVRRLFGGGMGIIFKGSGFYTTDYKHSSAGTSGNGSSRSESKSESKPESKGDSKSESKSSSDKTEPSSRK
jgi:putative FmdB family regulatory protein